MDNQKNVIGKFIRETRLAEKPSATQKDISARLETYGVFLSHSSISMIENGTRPITDIQIIAFAKALKVHPKCFFEKL